MSYMYDHDYCDMYLLYKVLVNLMYMLIYFFSFLTEDEENVPKTSAVAETASVASKVIPH